MAMNEEAHTGKLVEILRRDIRRRGGISFHDFMEAALYHPDHGYYTRGRRRIGRDGDYFTSVSVGPAFAQLVGTQCHEVWKACGRPGRFTVVEQGAGDGGFAADLLAWARSETEGFDGALHYVFVEPFLRMRELQREAVGAAARKCEWVDSPDDLTDARWQGVYFSNELADAFPVHLLVSDGKEWRECWVVERESGGLQFEERAPGAELQRLAQECLPQREAGYRAEINPHLNPWVEGVARGMEAGLFLVADYGRDRGDLYAPHRTVGTLRTFRQHRRGDNPLDRPGDTDLTADVDFTTVAQAAVNAGLLPCGYCDQHHFTVAAATPWLMRREGKRLSREESQWLAQFKTLMHPATMGMNFQLFGALKNLPDSFLPSGFTHARQKDLDRLLNIP